jgi:acetyl-CoA acetyltransferase
MAEYGTTAEMFARVGMKNHNNGSLNPYAQYQYTVTLEDVLNSRMICDPITLYQCSPTTDGASAAVVCAKEVAHRFRGKPITIAGWASGTAQYSPVGIGGDVTPGFTDRLAAEAYERAGLGPGDVDVAQVHDAFSPGEILAIESLGFCPQGEGGRFVWEGKADIGGQLPVNTDGGLESRGHPQGATGIAMLTEIVRQLRGEAGPRQVSGDPKVGLTHNVGVGGCNVFILKK